MKPINPQTLAVAAGNLARSERGRQAMVDLLAFLDNGALSLDDVNKQACMTILVGAFTQYPGTARDVMRVFVPACEAIGEFGNPAAQRLEDGL